MQNLEHIYERSGKGNLTVVAFHSGGFRRRKRRLSLLIEMIIMLLPVKEMKTHNINKATGNHNLPSDSIYLDKFVCAGVYVCTYVRVSGALRFYYLPTYLKHVSIYESFANHDETRHYSAYNSKAFDNVWHTVFINSNVMGYQLVYRCSSWVGVWPNSFTY